MFPPSRPNERVLSKDFVVFPQPAAAPLPVDRRGWVGKTACSEFPLVSGNALRGVIPPMLTVIDHELGHAAADADVFAGDHRCFL